MKNDTESRLERMNELHMAGQEATAAREERVLMLRTCMIPDTPFYIIPAKKRASDSDEMTVQALNQHGASAAVCTPDDLTAALVIDNGEPLPSVLFIVKEGQQQKEVDTIKAALEQAKMEGQDIPSVIIAPTDKPLSELTDNERSAWIDLTSAEIEKDKDAYQHSFGADLIDQDDQTWSEGRLEPISTGFPALDELLDGGLYPEALYSIGAISSLGKTTFCLQIADYIAASGRDVLYIALEQSAAELRAKTLSRMTDEIEHERGRLSVTQIMNAKKRAGWKGNNPKYVTTQERAYRAAIERYKTGAGKHMRIIEGVGNITVSRIRGDVEKNIRYRGVAPVVVVDYTQILAPAADKLTDKQNVDRNIVDLKRLARDKHIPVIAICSFNRDAYAAPVDKASFKESGGIEYSADALIGIHPKGMKQKKGDNEVAANKETVNACIDSNIRELEAVILKNRNGSTGTINFEYFTVCNRYIEKGLKPKPTKKEGFK